MCHRCDLYEEKKDQITTAMKMVDETLSAGFLPEGTPDDMKGDEILERIALFNPLEACLLGMKLTVMMEQAGPMGDKGAQWALAQLAATAECPTD